LLKGCERIFRPDRPQVRYCSDACRQEARHWQRWHSACLYRRTEEGQERRREQSRRYRQRVKQRVKQRTAEASRLEAAAACEGQRPEINLDDFAGRPCDRPGCYVLIALRPCSPQQRFCSCSCRLALRCVIEREARWRWRRERRRRQQRRQQYPRPPPS
jgi:hypothetical protein